jgi:hypothetical protein
VLTDLLDVPVDLGDRYTAVNRGLFFKVSCLQRF